MVSIVQEVEWAPGPVWTGVENLAPTGIRSPNRPARSQSLYRLRYPALSTRYHTQKYVCFPYSRTYIAHIKARFMLEFRIPLFWDPTFRATETSARNYHHTMRNIPEERRSQARFNLAWQMEVCRLNKKKFQHVL